MNRSWIVPAVDLGEPNRIVIERCFEDGRLAEVLDLGDFALVRVHAPSGKVYLEQTLPNAGEATVAITRWDGLGLPQPPPERAR